MRSATRATSFRPRTAASPRSVQGVRRPTCSSRCQSGRDWDLDVLTRYIRHTHLPVQRDMLIGSVRRRGGAWGAIAFVRPGHSFDRDDRHLIAAHHRGSVGCRSPDRPRPAPRRARSDRQKDDGADPSEGSLLPDPGWHPLVDALRSFVRAPHPRGRRGVAARGGGTDRLDEGQERADRTAHSHHG